MRVDLNLGEKPMADDRELEPVKAGWDNVTQRSRVGRAEQNERRPAGTQAAPDENIEKPLDGNDNTKTSPQGEAYLVRWLRTRYPVSAAIAGIIAAELGLGGAP
jgi:hypothetical protein